MYGEFSSLDDIRWFAENAHRQRVGPMRVLSMAEACAWYLGPFDPSHLEEHPWERPPTPQDILNLAALVEPDHNTGKSFRNVDLMIGYGQSIGIPWHAVPMTIDSLCLATEMEPDEWYRAFEQYHPLRDGNGRTGAILWNGHRWRKGLGTPGVWEHPPDYYDEEWWK